MTECQKGIFLLPFWQKPVPQRAPCYTKRMRKSDSDRILIALRYVETYDAQWLPTSSRMGAGLCPDPDAERELAKAQAERRRENAVLGCDFFARRECAWAERAAETAEHALAHPEVWGDSTPELVAHFAEHAAEHARNAEAWERVAALVRSGAPLP